MVTKFTQYFDALLDVERLPANNLTPEVIPVRKGGDRDSYRPLNLTFIVLKLLEGSFAT